jgi:cyanate lyase
MTPYSDREEMRTKVLEAKEEEGLTFSDLEEITGIDKTFIASAVYDAASTTEADAISIAEALGLADDEVVIKGLQSPPMKGEEEPTIPSDPALYRFYEVPQVYGPAMKAILHEEFGDGIMSAIDFEVSVDKEMQDGEEHVVITYDGKFLPYKKFP